MQFSNFHIVAHHLWHMRELHRIKMLLRAVEMIFSTILACSVATNEGVRDAIFKDIALFMWQYNVAIYKL